MAARQLPFALAALVLAAPLPGLMSPAVAQAPLAGNVRVPWVSYPEPARVDRGIGIAFFAAGPGTAAVVADTALVYARPHRRAAVTGAFLYQETMRGRASMPSRRGGASTPMWWSSPTRKQGFHLIA